MFCPSCGTEYAIELNYCNRCGANLSVALGKPTELPPINLTKPILIISTVIVMITLAGFAGIVSATIEMVEKGAGSVSPAIPVLGIPALLTIDILLLRQLSRLISAALSPNRFTPKSVPQAQTTASFPRPTAANLVPAPSVTENTTRFLEETYRPPSEGIEKLD